MTAHRHIDVAGLDVFYREAGDPDRPSVLLLHGFPSSSHMFRRLISRLSDRFHCVAPDLPGFGYTQAPPAGKFAYTFERLASVLAEFVDALDIARFSLYVFDIGAPVGLRLATAQPERIEALIVQNGNLYTEGLSDQTQALQAYWRHRAGNEPAIRGLLTAETTKFQYVHGAREPEQLEPDSWTLDQHFLELPGREEAMLDLFYDYRTNVELYPTWQRYLREQRPPTLVVWAQRPVLHHCRGAVHSARSARRRDPRARHRPLRAGGARRRDRGPHRALPDRAASGRHGRVSARRRGSFQTTTRLEPEQRR